MYIYNLEQKIKKYITLLLFFIKVHSTMYVYVSNIHIKITIKHPCQNLAPLSLRRFTPNFIFVTEKGQTEQKNRLNEKKYYTIWWEKITKFVDFLKIKLLKKVLTKIVKLKIAKIKYSEHFDFLKN